MAETSLIVADNLNPVKIFVEKDVQWIKDTIEKGVVELLEGANLDSATGRKKYASAAYQVARSKTLFDNLGKEFTEKRRKELNDINATKKELVDWCANKQAETRKPLTDWEEAEGLRVENHKANLDRIEKLADPNNVDGTPLNVGMLRAKLVELENIPIGESWQEYAGAAELAWSKSHASLCQAIKAREQFEKDQAELERLRKEQAEREAKERDERIAREAAEKARIAAEQKAAQEKAELERREREAKEAAEKAERDRIAAEERAKLESENAKKRAEAEKQAAVLEAQRKAQEEADRREKERLAKEAAEKDAAEQLARNKAHQGKINREALESLLSLGFEQEMAKQFITFVARGSVKHITINY